VVCLLGVLRRRGVGAGGGGGRGGSAGGGLVAGFGGYLAGERGFAAGPVQGYVSHARRFLEGLPPGTGLAGVCAKDVTEAVLRRSAAGAGSAPPVFVGGVGGVLPLCFAPPQQTRGLLPAARAGATPPAPR